MDGINAGVTKLCEVALCGIEIHILPSTTAGGMYNKSFAPHLIITITALFFEIACATVLSSLCY